MMTILNFEQAKHLVMRTGFGAESGVITKLIGLSREQAINTLLSAPRNFLTPQPVLNSFHQLRKITKADRENDTRFRRKLYRKDIKAVKIWAVEQALSSPNPLEEKMTWFWHNHFTSSSPSSWRSANLLMKQSLLIRRNALGDFSTLLASISHDPLMLTYLDGINNRKEMPNENFARELLELFTLGEGHYTEKDIKEIARAFTGLRFNNATQTIIPNDSWFDHGKKEIFGKKREFDSNGALNLLLMQPRVAEFIAEKMWYEFISIEPHNSKNTHQWARVFRDSKYDIAALIKAVLLDNVFWDPKYRGRLIKSPLDLVIGTLRALGLEDKNMPLNSIRVHLLRMGQDLYDPPNVKGWPGGIAWVDDIRLPFRQQFLRRLMRGNNSRPIVEKTSSMMSMASKATGNMMSGMRKQKNKNALRLESLPNVPFEKWGNWLLPIKAVTSTEATEPRVRLRDILLDPSYQLK